jgi:tetratricopeptide (TPR) repeat protein
MASDGRTSRLAYYFSHRTKEASPLRATTLGWKADDTYLRYALAMCHVYSQEPDKARDTFAELYGVPAESAQAALLASHFMNRENFASEAEALVRKAQEIDPSLPDLHYRLGVIDLTNGDHAGAAEHFRQELARNPLHPMAWHYLGAAYAQTGELQDAIASLERAIWLNLRNVPPYLLIANVYNRQNEYPLAENALRQALSFDPQNYEARFRPSRASR